MNRKDRRAAQKGKAAVNTPIGSSYAPFPAGLAANLFSGAVEKFRAGHLAEAERLCQDALSFDPRHADALHLLGMIAFQMRQPEAALDLIGRSLAINPHNADAHFNLSQILRSCGRADEAARHLAETTALKKDHGAAHAQLADICLQNGRLDEAVTRYRRALAIKPDLAEVCSNLGVALAGLGRWAEAVSAYRKALAFKPDLVDVYRNLGRILLERGDAAEALFLARRGLSVQETEEGRFFFVQCARATSAEGASAEVCGLVARALTEGWSRPSELAGIAGDLVKQTLGLHGPRDQDTLGAATYSVDAERTDFRELVRLADDTVVLALLESAPVCDVTIEQVLTRQRQTLLALAAQPDSDQLTPASVLRLFCGLAHQCFINEYVFVEGPDDAALVLQLQQRITAALAADHAISPLGILALAAFRPLHSLPHAERLLQRSWPDVLTQLLAVQVREPLLERELRTAIPAMTAIDDAVSVKVQHQYENMPYPRWVKPGPVGRPDTIEWYLRNQFPTAPLAGPLPQQHLDVLIAGCGTGQQSIEAARRYANARVLAIDLSRTSLGYALRKTRELGVNALTYGQADILKLGQLSQTFDVIESSGVLHHLADPVAGWQTLLSLLRPRGVMNIGLYSAIARSQIRMARAFIADQGFGDTADGIRRCRQAIIALPEDAAVREVIRYPDFYSLSECRDLLFHVQEHQVTIPAIKAFIDAHGLTFLGFSGQPAVEFRRHITKAGAATDLDQWHAFEMQNPTAFSGMYQFWVQKR